MTSLSVGVLLFEEVVTSFILKWYQVERKGLRLTEQSRGEVVDMGGGGEAEGLEEEAPGTMEVEEEAEEMETGEAGSLGIRGTGRRRYLTCLLLPR